MATTVTDRNSFWVNYEKILPLHLMDRAGAADTRNKIYRHLHVSSYY